ncbi:MAG: DUF2490 domain-containing protein [Myxococcota bacterium]
MAMVLWLAPVAKADSGEETQAWAAMSARADMLDRKRGPTLWVDVQTRHGVQHTRSLIRPGVAWRFNARSSVWLGYFVMPTFTAGQPARYEHRTWEDLQLTLPSAHWKLALRNRVEQRYFEGSHDMAWRLRERVKVAWRPAATLPLSLIVSDEVFVHFNDVERHVARGFDQNRLFVGIGWTASDEVGLEAGYLHQHLDRTPDRDAHVIFASLAFRHRPPPPAR